jgi:hypothetical protein
MYAELRTSDTLHKKSSCIGPVLCGLLHLDFAEFLFHALQ